MRDPTGGSLDWGSSVPPETVLSESRQDLAVPPTGGTCALHRIFTDAEAIASCPVRMLGGKHRWVWEHEGKPREMKLNRKSVTWGLAGLALAGALVGGAGVAVAATGTTSTSPSAVSSADPPYGHMGMGDMDGMGDMAGMAFGENSPMEAAAGYLGLSRTDLQAQLQNGQSLADVAAAQGKSVSGLEDAMVAAMTNNLDANTTLTAEEKAADLALMRSHLDVMVRATHSSGAGFGPMGAGVGGMMGR